MKCNSYGSCISKRSKASCGVVIHDLLKARVLGFNQNIGSRNAILKKLWGIAFRLKMAWNLGFYKVCMEVDSSTALHLAIHSVVTSILMPILFETLARSKERIRPYCHKEGNRVAD